jgi:hypothetical protein
MASTAVHQGHTPSDMFATIIGKTEADARTYIEEAGYFMRVTIVNGAQQIVTMEKMKNRLNVSVRDGLVDAILTFG